MHFFKPVALSFRPSLVSSDHLVVSGFATFPPPSPTPQFVVRTPKPSPPPPLPTFASGMISAPAFFMASFRYNILHGNRSAITLFMVIIPQQHSSYPRQRQTLSVSIAPLERLPRRSCSRTIAKRLPRQIINVNDFQKTELPIYI